MPLWKSVHRELRSTPIVNGNVPGEAPLYAERYLLQGRDRAMSGYPIVGLIVLFGGARVLEGEDESSRGSYLPSQALLLPPGCATHWHLSGPSDFGIFYFLTTDVGVAARLRRLADSASGPLRFSDPLVGAAAQQIFNELRKGGAGDEAYLATLAKVLLEQTYRALTTPETGLFSPRHVHFPRLQTVLPYIQEHLSDNLPVQQLAELAGLSDTHFRRIFQEALGVPVHRYVLAARLEKARKLLGTTGMPIAKIADVTGFSSQSHLTSCFRAAHAATPAEYRRHLGKSAKARAGPASGA